MRDTLMMNKNTDEEAQKIMDAMGDGLAQEETAQEILKKVKGSVGTFNDMLKWKVAKVSKAMVENTDVSFGFTGAKKVHAVIIHNTDSSTNNLTKCELTVDGTTYSLLSAKNSGPTNGMHRVLCLNGENTMALGSIGVESADAKVNSVSTDLPLFSFSCEDECTFTIATTGEGTFTVTLIYE